MALLLADINWQLDNGLDYYVRHVRPDLNVARVTDRVLTLPLLVHDNLAAGREVVMTPESRRIAEAAYGGLFSFAPDPRVDARPLAHGLAAVPADTVYVLALLAPYRDLPFDAQGLADAARRLTGGAATLVEGPSYQVLAGRVGRAARAGSPGDAARFGPPFASTALRSTCGWNRGCRRTRSGGLASAT